MKKVILWLIAIFLVISAVSLDVSAAKKAGKISKEEVQEMSDSIDNLTKKIYGRAQKPFRRTLTACQQRRQECLVSRKFARRV